MYIRRSSATSCDARISKLRSFILCRFLCYLFFQFFCINSESMFVSVSNRFITLERDVIHQIQSSRCRSRSQSNFKRSSAHVVSHFLSRVSSSTENDADLVCQKKKWKFEVVTACHIETSSSTPIFRSSNSHPPRARSLCIPDLFSNFCCLMSWSIYARWSSQNCSNHSPWPTLQWTCIVRCCTRSLHGHCHKTPLHLHLPAIPYSQKLYPHTFSLFPSSTTPMNLYHVHTVVSQLNLHHSFGHHWWRHLPKPSLHAPALKARFSFLRSTTFSSRTTIRIRHIHPDPSSTGRGNDMW